MKKILTFLTCILILSCQSNKGNTENIVVQEINTSKTARNNNHKQIDTLLNTNDYLILGNKFSKVKVVTKGEIENFPAFEVLIKFQNDVVIGKNVDVENVRIFKKYQPQSSFKDFPAVIYKGILADPDFSTNPEAMRFQTQIKNQCAKGINFAGQYTLVRWGCGSPCQSGVIVDRKTGKIYSGITTSFGSKFKKDSKMIIRNVGVIDTTTNLIEVCAYCTVKHEIWTGTEFNEVE